MAIALPPAASPLATPRFRSRDGFIGSVLVGGVVDADRPAARTAQQRHRAPDAAATAGNQNDFGHNTSQIRSGHGWRSDTDSDSDNQSDRCSTKRGSWHGKEPFGPLRCQARGGHFGLAV